MKYLLFAESKTSNVIVLSPSKQDGPYNDFFIIDNGKVSHNEYNQLNITQENLFIYFDESFYDYFIYNEKTLVNKNEIGYDYVFIEIPERDEFAKNYKNIMKHAIAKAKREFAELKLLKEII
jgi:hypothetical protein